MQKRAKLKVYIHCIGEAQYEEMIGLRGKGENCYFVLRRPLPLSFVLLVSLVDILLSLSCIYLLQRKTYVRYCILASTTLVL